MRERLDVAALGGIVLATFTFPQGVPAGIYGLGIVSGASLALNAIGLVLIYRANRIINFAQVQIGAVAATLFVVMANTFPLRRAVNTVCPPCLERPSSWELRANYYISLALALVVSALLAYLIYTFIVKRFANAPRLVLTLATVFAVQLLGGIQGLIPTQLSTADQREAGLLLAAPGPPFDWTVEWSPALFRTPEILTVVVGLGAVGGLLVYFRRSSTGVAIRAAAENATRVSTLGVNVDKVTSRVWIVAGALSAAAALLSAMSVGAPGLTASGGLGLDVSTLLKMLTVAVVARMVSLPLTAAAAVAFGVLEQAVQWSFGSTVVLDGILVLIIGAMLSLQRYKASRAELEQANSWKADREARPVPAELKHLPFVQQWVRWGTGLGVLVLIGYPWAASTSQVNLAAVWMIYAMVGISLLVLTGWAGQISLGQFAFAAVGGYVAAASRLPFPVALMAGSVSGAVVAVLIGIPAIKLRGLHLAIMTLALAASSTALLLNPRYLGRHLPATLDRPTVLGMSFEDGRTFYYFTLLMLVLVNLGVMGIRRSRTARALIACRDNERAAQSFGINVVRARLGAFAISGFIAAFAGALFAFHQHGVTTTAYPTEQSVTMFLIAVIGGFGSIAGPQIGALYFGILGLLSNSPIVMFLGTGGIGLLILMVLPGGLIGGFQQVRDSVLRRVAKRNRIVVPSLVADVRVEGTEEERAPLQPKVRSGGGSVFVPERYGLKGQWAIGLGDETVLHANLRSIRGEGNGGSRATFGVASDTGDPADD